MNHLETLLDLLQRYPVLWTILAPLGWAVATGLLTAVLDHTMPRTDEEWAALFKVSPRFAAACNLLKLAGFNLPGSVRAVRVLLKGRPPEWLVAKPPRTREEVLESLWKLGREERDKAIEMLQRQNDQDPKPPEAT